MAPTFLCKECSKNFSVTDATLAKYPGWQPGRCFSCKGSSGSREQNLTVQEVLEKYTLGPKTGVFTDGSSDPNPGPGGWGAVYVVDDVVVAEDYGHDPQTTNNRMEIIALIAACRLIPAGTPMVVYTDSELCVNTFTKWAKGWEAKGWKRKGSPLKNLELVQELHAMLTARPEIELKWIKAHAGNKWNEYADALATVYRRKEK